MFVKMLRFWTVVVVTLIVDLASKSYVFNWLIDTPTQGITIIDKWFSLNLHINRGAVWGLGGGSPILLIAITAIIIPIVIYLAYSSQKGTRAFLPLLGFGMLLGGAIGNLYDRVFTEVKLNAYPQSYHGVRDFLDLQVPGVYNWPVFNVADIAIVIGVVIFALWSLIETPKKEEK